VIFVISSVFAGVSEDLAIMYGYIGELITIRDLLLERNMSATYSPLELNLQTQGKIKSFIKHSKDPIQPWISSKNFVKKCHKLVEGID